MLVFGLAIGLAFGLSGGDDGAPEPTSAAAPGPAAAESPTPPGTVASPESAVPASSGPLADGPAQNDAPGEPVAEPEAAAPEPSAPALADLTGFSLPIEGVCLTEFEGHLPGAPREYRNGVHEGFDFYGWASCRPIDRDTPLLAAKAGVILRIDRAYQELTLEQYAAAEAAGFQGDAILDLLRGRQVWIDHGNSVVTRFAHLGAVAAGLERGDTVRAGQVVGFVGESGTPESLFAPGTDEHGHFEIRVGESYLGAGLPLLEARTLYLRAFGLVEGEADEPTGP